MNTQERREAIKQTIATSEKPISATKLAQMFHVSRQIVVGDVALLRAAQENIIATPRGYIYQMEKKQDRYVIACSHDGEHTEEELQIIVDLGGSIENVIISHPIYGELIGALHIASRLDISEFLKRCKETGAKNLSEISDGLHLHTISCRSDKEYHMILESLREKGFLYEK